MLRTELTSGNTVRDEARQCLVPFGFKIKYAQTIYTLVKIVRANLGGNMRIWLACFFVLFALAELFDWVKQITLPLPIYILGGAFLAIASNYNKRWGFFLGNSSAQSPSVIDSGYSPTQSISSGSNRAGEQQLYNS